LKYCQAKDILLHSNLPALFGNWKDRDDLFLTPESQKSIRQLYKNKHIRSCEMSSYFSCACTSGLEKLHITAYGDVLPCAFIPVSFGNILQDDLSSIRKRILEFPFFKQHNEMCIPSTNRQYHQFYKAHINPVKILPVQYDAIKDFL
jgi:MoaA/NifB/PqqE/SkfB family radical SAM enzyme